MAGLSIKGAKHSPYRKPKGGRKKLVAVLSVLSVLLVAAGVYVLALCFSPQLTYMPVPVIGWNPPPINYTEINDDRLYIPKINVNIGYKPGSEAVLDSYAWHRYPERGDPVQGGNFIIAAHRFQIGFSPGETRRKSPFYNLNQLVDGDSIYVDHQGVRYKYQVTSRYKVAPTQLEIESPSAEHKMTLYTCTLQGAEDGREVVEAKLVETDLDVRTKLN